MKKGIKLMILACFLLVASNASAQMKIGHINSADLLTAMPQAKSAEKELEIFANQKKTQLENKVKNLESEFKSVQANIPNMSQVEIQKKEQYFAGKQEEIGKFELQAQQDIAKKREEVLGPVLQRAENAIQAVARDNGYTYILDTSLGSVLFALPAEDIMDKVRGKLGI